MPKNSHINYIELKAYNLEQTKQFYSEAFGWAFTDYGPTYIAFSNSGLEGGLEKTDHKNLDAIKSRIISSNGTI
ncbi:VOC family protein [Tamlana crocina]|uniref:VOC family protein n=1 Tax=Tamlana crocina TaxID=393006 RepID=UPI001FD7849A|nr:hypothetical protein [Tamlana crocina]